MFYMMNLVRILKLEFSFYFLLIFITTATYSVRPNPDLEFIKQFVGKIPRLKVLFHLLSFDIFSVN